MSGSAYSTPTLSELIAQAQADVTDSELEGADGLLPVSNLVIMAMVQAHLAYDHYGYLARVANNCTPFFAEAPFLDAWGALKDVLRKDASFAGAASAVQFVGTPGLPIFSETALTRSDGVGFVVAGGGTIPSSGTLDVSVAADIAGSAANTSIGALISIANPITGINSGGTVVAPITGGADQEDDDDLRGRILAVYAAPPQGGCPSDYEEWATAVPGVTRAWCIPNQMGAGTVVVFVMLDETEAAHGGFPQGTTGVAAAEPRAVAATGDQLTVANALFPQRGATALVYVAAPIPQQVPFTFLELNPNTPAMQAAVSAALSGLLLRKGSAKGGTLWESDWTAALNAVPGLTNFALGLPDPSFSWGTGYLPTLGVVNFPAL